MAPFVSARAPSWSVLMGGKPADAAVDELTAAHAVRHQRHIQVRRQSLGPQTVLLRPRWDRPITPAQALPPLGIA
jgi:hypothetical protein